MIKLTKQVYRDVDTFLGIAESEGWDEGTTLTQPEQAQACGISYRRLKVVVQAIKENPEWGITVHVSQKKEVVRRYDPDGLVVTLVTFSGSPIEDREVDTVRRVGNDTLEGSVMRLTRGATGMALAWKRIDKRRQSGKDMKPYVTRTRSFLMSMRDASAADGDLLGIQEQVEQALALLGVRYDDDDE